MVINIKILHVNNLVKLTAINIYKSGLTLLDLRQLDTLLYVKRYKDQRTFVKSSVEIKELK